MDWGLRYLGSGILDAKGRAYEEGQQSLQTSHDVWDMGS